MHLTALVASCFADSYFKYKVQSQKHHDALTYTLVVSEVVTFTPTGVTIFDCEEQTLAGIAEKMVNEMVNKNEIRPGDKEGVLKSLLQNRRYPARHQPTVTQT